MSLLRPVLYSPAGRSGLVVGFTLGMVAACLGGRAVVLFLLGFYWLVVRSWRLLVEKEGAL